MTRREIYALILLEALILGALGTLLGAGAGRGVGTGAVQLVARTMNDLFFVVAVRRIDIPTWTLAKGAAIGIGAALLGAAVPALEATSVPPAGALKRAATWKSASAASCRGSPAALALLLLGVGLLLPEWNLVVTFAGLFAVIIGFALLTPAVTLVLMRGWSGRHAGPASSCAWPRAR
ncbi:MAG: FtsX-like permease family protein [Caldilineaceae bacterium]